MQGLTEKSSPAKMPHYGSSRKGVDVMNNRFKIANLGICQVESPLNISNFVNDQDRILFHTRLAEYARIKEPQGKPLSVEPAGPREKIFFHPDQTKAAIVTCGGLCPGINDVIRSVTMTLFYRYGVKNILGIKYGLRGLNPGYGDKPVKLTPDYVKDITHIGGSILSSSRGPQDAKVMVDYLESLNVNILFCVGGDGTMRAAEKLTAEITERRALISVIGIPKTIDNDVSFIDRSFGFLTAGSEARKAIASAHSEASGAINGVGLVKLMGRDSGFIAAYAVLADNEVNFCLIPEIPFSLDVFLDALEKRLIRRGHAVIVVAEGAGQHLLGMTHERDASGNIRYNLYLIHI